MEDMALEKVERTCYIKTKRYKDYEGKDENGSVNHARSKDYYELNDGKRITNCAYPPLIPAIQAF